MITTHVLDTARGRPAAGMRVVLEAEDGHGWAPVGGGVTDADGRVPDLHAAGEDIRQRIAAGNAEYEARFGHVFLISAAGRDAPEILAALTERLGNDPATELRVAAEEQRRITRLRLERLMAE